MNSTASTEIVSAPTSSSKTPAFIYGALLFLFVMMLAGFYFIWQQQRHFHQYQQQSDSADHVQDKLLQQSRDDQQALQTLMQEQLAQLDLRLEKLNRSDRSDWLLAETEFLLRMANQYATLANDAKSAETLLAQADEVMKELEKSIGNGKTIINIRRKIADERATLKIRSELDREGLYLQLDSLIKQIDKSAVVDIGSMSKQKRSMEASDLSPEPSISSRMLKSLQRALEKIGGYLRIQQHDREIGPLLSPNEQEYLKQNLRLRLEQAESALLQHQQVVYQASLRDAREWINKYYVIDPELKNKWLAELDACISKNVAEPLPDISGSLAALKSYMQTRD